jgi:enoyl-CoA hydratase
MNYKNIDFEKEGTLGVISLKRPDARNALSDEMIEELNHAIGGMGSDEIRALIITGGDKYFCSGFDLKLLNREEGMSKSSLMDTVDRLRLFEKRLEHGPRPVIAAICGPCLAGGLEIAISCDLRIASENAIFGLPEIRFGALAFAGATQRLPRMIPVGLAKELHLIGEPINAQEAYRIGLVNRVVSNESVMEVAKNMGRKLAARSPAAVKLCKFLINAGMKVDMNTAMDYETELSRFLVEAPGFEEAKNKAATTEEKYKHIFRTSEKKNEDD